MNSILIKPLITEKSMRDATANRFTFKVATEANKPQIAIEVAQTFGVKVLGVKTTTIKSRAKRTGRKRQEVFTQPSKKAIVELAKGQKIDLFDVVENPKGSTPS